MLLSISRPIIQIHQGRIKEQPPLPLSRALSVQWSPPSSQCRPSSAPKLGFAVQLLPRTNLARSLPPPPLFPPLQAGDPREPTPLAPPHLPSVRATPAALAARIARSAGRGHGAQPAASPKDRQLPPPGRARPARPAPLPPCHRERTPRAPAWDTTVTAALSRASGQRARALGQGRRRRPCPRGAESPSPVMTGGVRL